MSTIDTNTTNAPDAEQELKSSWVQVELVGEEPYRVSLKSERVQEPALAAGGGEGKRSSLFELAVNQLQPMTIELLALEVVITLHGAAAGIGTAGSMQTRDVAG